jgi:hypothetical protein
LAVKRFSILPLIRLPLAEFFDFVEPLDSALEKAGAFLDPAPFLSASLSHFLMWQDEFAYALVSKGPALWVVALYGQYVYLPAPPKPFAKETLDVAFEYMRKVNGPGRGVSRIEGLTEEQKKQAEAWGYPARPTLTEYLYDQSLVAGVHGDAYRAKRAEANHLIKEHAVLMRPYRSGDLKACGELFELWKSERLPALKGQMGEKMLLASQKAHFRALHQGEDWGMDAWVVFLENRLAAYSVGAGLSTDTYGLYLEVTDLTVKGLSAYIFVNVCRQLGRYPFINAGDAEGLPNLAESKEHWHPLRHLRVYAADPVGT